MEAQLTLLHGQGFAPVLCTQVGSCLSSLPPWSSSLPPWSVLASPGTAPWHSFRAQGCQQDLHPPSCPLGRSQLTLPDVPRVRVQGGGGVASLTDWVYTAGRQGRGAGQSRWSTGQSSPRDSGAGTPTLPGRQQGCTHTGPRALPKLCLFHRTTEHPEQEGTHKHHPVQLLTLSRPPQHPQPVPESITQTVLELWQPWGHDHSLGSLFPLPVTLWGRNLFLIPNLSLP